MNRHSTVSRGEISRHRDFEVGDVVLGYAGWQDYAVSGAAGLTPLYPGDPHPSRALGVLGMPGLTACGMGRKAQNTVTVRP